MLNKVALSCFVAMVIYSCDEPVSAIYEIDNRTGLNGNVTFYASSRKDISFIIPAESVSVILNFEHLGASRIVLDLVEDSIVFRFDNNMYIKYYKDSTFNWGKSIYKVQNWEVEKINKRNAVCTFPIDTEDLPSVL